MLYKLTYGTGWAYTGKVVIHVEAAHGVDAEVEGRRKLDAAVGHDTDTFRYPTHRLRSVEPILPYDTVDDARAAFAAELEHRDA